MPEHDPIEELSRFGAELGRAGGDMPLSAADVRRRGDRIRRRRTALVAGGAAFAVAVVTAPVLLLTGHQDRDLTTKDPHQAPLSERDLLTDDDTVYNDGADWFAVEPASGTAAFRFCERRDLTSFGASDTLWRDFELRNLDDPEVEVTGDGFRESAGQFPDVASARAAYDDVVAFVQDCAEGVAVGGPFEPRTVDTGRADSEAVVIDAHFGDVPADIDPYGDSAYISEVGIVRVGDRLAVLDSAIVGQDYDFTDGTPVERMVPRAAELLEPGDPSDAEAHTTTDPEDDTTDQPYGAPPSVIPDDFPLASSWPDPEPAGDMKLEGPTRTLGRQYLVSACGRDAPDEPTPTDRLYARFTQPEDYRLRQLSTYASEEDAAAAAAALVTTYRDCPTEPADQDGFVAHHSVATGELGDESWVLGTWLTLDGAPAVGIDVTTVIRVGTALLVVVGSNEGGATDPQGDIATTASGMADDAAGVVESLCAYTATGC